VRALEGEGLLQAWERSRGRSVPRAALAILELAESGKTFEDLSILPLADRNLSLLEARALSFGPGMQVYANCPDCGSALEFELDGRDLSMSIRSAAALPGQGRPADTSDLLACLEAGDPARGRAILLERTLGWETAAREPPAELLERFDELNESAEIRLQASCEGCGGNPVVDLDLAGFVLKEVARAARDLLTQVHILAGSYGWSEDRILEMGTARRSAYLGLLAA